jgi:hypothetical protein
MTRWASSCSCPPDRPGSCVVCADFADSPRGGPVLFVGLALLAIVMALVWSVVMLVSP